MTEFDDANQRIRAAVHRAFEAQEAAQEADREVDRALIGQGAARAEANKFAKLAMLKLGEVAVEAGYDFHLTTVLKIWGDTSVLVSVSFSPNASFALLCQRDGSGFKSADPGALSDPAAFLDLLDSLAGKKGGE
jgi:hypothetical protein